MCNEAIEIHNLGKMYKLYRNPKDKILDAFGLNFLKKNYYEEFWALRNMDLIVPKGERVGLIGCNGAGKSTLLKMVVGNVMPSEGEIKVNGEIQALMELGTGFHPEFTGRQNIRASLAYRGLSINQIKEKEEEIIDFSELEDFIDQPIRTYSAGMNARLSFSTATAISPDILIVDEVLGAGDAYFSGKCVERMRKITEESGATVLFVSHDLNSILQLCNRVIWIERGKIRMQGDPIDVVKEYMSTVRKREELRLKARDQKKYSQAIEGDVGKKVLFRIVTVNEEAPTGDNRIYRVQLKNKTSQEIASIDIGEPMDNGQEQNHYIIVDKQYTDWGLSSQDENGTYRSYMNIGGAYNHAPFCFHIYDEEEFQTSRLEIAADVKEELLVQMYMENKYVTLGNIFPTGFSNLQFDIFKSETSTQESKDEVLYEADFEYKYGNKKMNIKSVELVNSRNQKTRILETEEYVKVDIEFDAYERISSPVFVFCIYTSDGKCASQWISDQSDYGQHEIFGHGVFRFHVDRLLLGKGLYIASVGIFNGISVFGEESESYCVIDRSVHFEIVQPLNQAVERGMCLQPFRGELLNEK